MQDQDLALRRQLPHIELSIYQRMHLLWMLFLPHIDEYSLLPHLETLGGPQEPLREEGNKLPGEQF